MQLKSYIARVTRNGADCKVMGVVLNDGTPIKAVEVRVDVDGHANDTNGRRTRVTWALHQRMKAARRASPCVSP